MFLSKINQIWSVFKIKYKISFEKCKRHDATQQNGLAREHDGTEQNSRLDDETRRRDATAVATHN